MNIPLIPRARDFAFKAHEGLQSETVNGYVRPHIMHIQEVADLVWAAGGSDEQVAAAWLHDTVEDTPTTIADIERHFGTAIRDLVDGLTDRPEIEGLPTAERKQRQADRVKDEPQEVKFVKIADQTSNVRTIALDPSTSIAPAESRDYIEGARKIVDQCRGASPLLERLFDEAYVLGKKRFS